MGDTKTFLELSKADQLALIGNILICFGGMAVSVAQLLKMSESGRLAEHAFSPSFTQTTNRENKNSYFDL